MLDQNTKQAKVLFMQYGHLSQREGDKDGGRSYEEVKCRGITWNEPRCGSLFGGLRSRILKKGDALGRCGTPPSSCVAVGQCVRKRYASKVFWGSRSEAGRSAGWAFTYELHQITPAHEPARRGQKNPSKVIIKGSSSGHCPNAARQRRHR